MEVSGRVLYFAAVRMGTHACKLLSFVQMCVSHQTSSHLLPADKRASQLQLATFILHVVIKILVYTHGRALL